MEFTIITICRNIKDTIGRTCESIINQTYQYFEWIVVDGNSDDGTYEILQTYKNRIDYLIHEPDSGIYNAMNKGIRYANGEYLLFLNGGDEFYSNDILEKIKKKLNSDIVYGDIIVKQSNKEFLFRNQRKLCKKSLFKNTISHPAAFIKTEISKKNIHLKELI